MVKENKNKELSSFLDFLGKKKSSKEIEEKLTEYKNKVKKDRT